MTEKRIVTDQELNTKSVELKDVNGTIKRITDGIRKDILINLRKEGAVVGISGGIDSSVTISLVCNALDPDNVIGLLLPEKDSDPSSRDLALELASQLGIRTIEESISPPLVGFGCYKRRDAAVKRLFPEYDSAKHKMKIGINQQGLKQNLPPLFSATIIDGKGEQQKKLIPLKEYLEITSASNFKQRTRMAMLYYHAERLNYAVVGTANKHETNQGFFVKYGDSAVDLMPLNNLYKTQIYQIARQMELPEEIIIRTPTSDTYPAEQTQEEFFFQFPFAQLDILWYAYENQCSHKQVSKILGIPEVEVEVIFNNFKRKQATSEYLRTAALRDY